MAWPPYFTLDLAGRGLLPAGWDDDLLALSDAAERHVLETGRSDDGDWSFAVVQGDMVRQRCGWMLALYRGPLLDFAQTSFDRPLFAANRLRSAITLNIMSGVGAKVDWHVDANPVSGLFFGTSPSLADSGDLIFRDAAGVEERLVPKAGTFVCFDASVDHRVAALRSPDVRLSVPMVYYASATDQPIAYGADVYA